MTPLAPWINWPHRKLWCSNGATAVQHFSLPTGWLGDFHQHDAAWFGQVQAQLKNRPDAANVSLILEETPAAKVPEDPSPLEVAPYTTYINAISKIAPGTLDLVSCGWAGKGAVRFGGGGQNQSRRSLGFR